ncbi:MAG: sulfurtransferase TusA family protein [Nitrospirae bacterium]|nr:sulfurtransferase TusA family protein [Nitrospirota bacterium]
MDIKADKVLDCKGLSCPLPVLKTKKAIEELKSGQILEMIATDPGSKNDMEAWANRTGNPIIGTKEDAGTYVFFIKKS